MKKIISVVLILIVLLFFSSTTVKADLFDDDDGDIDEIIEKDEGGLFEKIIAKMIRRTCSYSI